MMLIFRSIVGKLWFAIVLLAVFILVILGLVLSKEFEDLFFQQKWNEMRSHGRELAKILAQDHDRELVQKEINFWGQISGFKIAVTDTKGTVVYSSDKQHSAPGTKMAPPELALVLDGKEPAVKRYHQTYNQDMLSVMLPLWKNGLVTGVVMLHSPLEHINDFLISNYKTVSAVIIVAVILSTALGLVVARVLTVPLLKMNRVAGQMAEGNFNLRVNVKGNDEIGLLGNTLNMLSTRLYTTLRDLAGKNEELRRVLGLQKEFLANVSHELRSPLFLIQGYTEAMVDGLAKEGQVQEKSLRIMLEETLRLRRLVEDLLTLSRTGNENFIEALNEVNLEPILDKVSHMFAQQAARQQVSVIVEGKRPLPLVKGNEDRLEQVLTNLVDNALRYSPPGGQIKIRTEVTPEGLQVSVSDQGPGIPEEELPYIWERFYKVDKARIRKGSGTGLGLAIAHNIVEAHGGRIWVESKTGEGTIFKFVIPMLEPEN